MKIFIINGKNNVKGLNMYYFCFPYTIMSYSLRLILTFGYWVFSLCH